MVHKNSIIKMVDEIPKLMKSIIGDFEPSLEKKLDRNEYKTILHIYKFPNKPMGFYCKYIQIESGSFTYVTDKLVDKQWVKKEKNQSDKRQTSLVLTAAGEQVAIKIKSQLEKHLENKLSELSMEDWEKLDKATQLIEEINQKLNQ